MVKKATYFEDSTGAVHKTEQAAWKAELVIFLLDSHVVNEASANTLADHIISKGNWLVEITSHLSFLTPREAA